MDTVVETPAPRCADCNLPLVRTGNGEERACYRCVVLPARRRAAAERRKLGHVVAGVDLDRALAAYRKLPPFVGNLGKIRLEVGHRTSNGTCGRAWTTQRRIRIAAGLDATPERVLELLVHEMCHLAVPPREGHSERFRRTLRRACKELWGIDVPLDAPASQGCVAYRMDAIAQATLKAKIEAGEIDLFPPGPPQAKPTRAEKATALVERRAAHAAKMLAECERNLQSVRRTLAKWRAKVRYYERTAAKKAAT